MNPSLNEEQISKFLEEDDGKPFYVANNVKFYDIPQTSKEEYEGKTNEEIVQPYSEYWLSFVIPRGSYPVFAVNLSLSFLESRGLENASKWTDTVLVRYKSRRVFAEIITDEGFDKFHDLKYITTDKSIALPTSPLIHLVKLEYFIALLLLSISLTFQLVINSRYSKVNQ